MLLAWQWLALRWLVTLGATALTCGVFTLAAPLQAGFLPLVLGQAFVATPFFEWLPLYLPELFPTAVGVFFAGALFAALGGSSAIRKSARPPA